MNLSDKVLKLTDVYPFNGIKSFYDISGILASPSVLGEVVDFLSEQYKDTGVASICGIDARGFILGPLIARKLNLPFIMIRKAGKMGNCVSSEPYDKEYGKSEPGLCVPKHAIKAGDRVVLVDDLVATGGTIKAAADLVRHCGGLVTGIACVFDLPHLRKNRYGIVTSVVCVREPEEATVHVCSTNQLKIDAVDDAFKQMGINSRTHGHRTLSNVSEQPCGWDEIFTGARNRVDTHEYTHESFIVGIENGVVEVGPAMFDAAVIIIKHNGEYHYSISTGVKLDEASIAAMEGGNNWSNLCDPHSEITKGHLSRKAIITQAVISCISSCIQMTHDNAGDDDARQRR